MSIRIAAVLSVAGGDERGGCFTFVLVDLRRSCAGCLSYTAFILKIADLVDLFSLLARFDNSVTVEAEQRVHTLLGVDTMGSF